MKSRYLLLTLSSIISSAVFDILNSVPILHPVLILERKRTDEDAATVSADQSDFALAMLPLPSPHLLP